MNSVTAKNRKIYVKKLLVSQGAKVKGINKMLFFLT